MRSAASGREVEGEAGGEAGGDNRRIILLAARVGDNPTGIVVATGGVRDDGAGDNHLARLDDVCWPAAT